MICVTTYTLFSYVGFHCFLHNLNNWGKGQNLKWSEQHVFSALQYQLQIRFPTHVLSMQNSIIWTGYKSTWQVQHMLKKSQPKELNTNRQILYKWQTVRHFAWSCSTCRNLRIITVLTPYLASTCTCTLDISFSFLHIKENCLMVSRK